MGRHANLLLPPDRSGDENGIFLARIRRGERIEHFETIRIRKDGSEIGVLPRFRPDTNGKIVGASHVARNITDRTVTERPPRTSPRLSARPKTRLSVRISTA